MESLGTPVPVRRHIVTRGIVAAGLRKSKAQSRAGPAHNRVLP
jgi:hypothetical protein